eukprot:m.35386 g.35386  ORF g.35386 m.35386 type:complete len:413 (+) comp10922_c0_seq2:286-1524(+)
MALRRRGQASVDPAILAYRQPDEEDSGGAPTAPTAPSAPPAPAAAAKSSSWLSWGTAAKEKKDDDAPGEASAPPLFAPTQPVPATQGQDASLAEAGRPLSTQSPVVSTPAAPKTWMGAVVGGAASVAGATATVATALAAGTARTAAGVVSGAVVGGVPGAIVGGVASTTATAAQLGVAGAMAVGSTVVGAAGSVVSSLRSPSSSAAAPAAAATSSSSTTVAGQLEKNSTDKSSASAKTAASATSGCAECGATFSAMRCWRYTCPNCSKDYCSACLTNQQQHRVPRLRVIEPVPLCKTCYFVTCTQCCGGKCFSEWPVAQLKQFLKAKNIECQAIEKYDIVKAINAWGSVESVMETDAPHPVSAFSVGRLHKMPVSQLRALLDRKGIAHAHCIEKGELVDLARSTRGQNDHVN